jgi:nucleotide-binding universal stress UspA family protein
MLAGAGVRRELKERRRMPKPILVGFDPNTADRAPVHFGVAAARFTGAPLIIGSVHADAVVIGQMGHGRMDDEISSEAGGPLEHLRIELNSAGVEAQYNLLGGWSAPSGLHRGAEEFDAGLLVVGSTDRGGLNRVLPGSTAERLLTGAPCPVAVVPTGWKAGGGLHRIGVAFADTPEGNEALDSALAVARRAGAKVRILTAVKEKEFGRAAGGHAGHEATSYDAAGAAREQLDQDLTAIAAQRAPGVEVEVDVSVQDAAEFLIAASEHVDLMVIGSRGYGPKRAVLLGGVSRKVTTAARCPVIVLARGAETGLRQLVDASTAAAA